MQNYPNPFNPSTTISYKLERPSRAHLAVYNLKGQLVKVLSSGHMQSPGHYQVVWDGSDSSGQPVSSGVYVYRLNCEGRAVAKRMVMMK